MPVYEYYCGSCRETFALLRPMAKADAAVACASCDSLETQRVLSLFAIRTSGNGGARQASAGGCGCGGGGCGCRAH